MNCPVCKTDMVVLELEEVEIDYCLDCQGIWLDRGELEQLFDDESRASKVMDAFTPCRDSHEKPRKCPLCRKKMQKIWAGKGESAPLIDKCVNNEGLWFDKGELADVIKQGSLDPDHKIVKLLSDIFNG
ncbi:MAG: zf-TFIIB domain-containing protein [Sedimentisphaerales bacterium]|nr:zf-TFIIB domain-containing protein [Sedimentisphaerales bacterium]